jgi:hypothetical protein
MPAGEVMLDRQTCMKAERLGLDVEVEIIAETLAGLGRKTRRVGLGLLYTSPSPRDAE